MFVTTVKLKSSLGNKVRDVYNIPRMENVRSSVSIFAFVVKDLPSPCKLYFSFSSIKSVMKRMVKRK